MNSGACTRITWFLGKGLLNYTAGHLVNMYVNIYRIIHTIVCVYKIYIYRPTAFASDCSPFLRVFHFPTLKLRLRHACGTVSWGAGLLQSLADRLSEVVTGVNTGPAQLHCPTLFHFCFPPWPFATALHEECCKIHWTEFNNFCYPICPHMAYMRCFFIPEMYFQEHVWTPDGCSGGKELLSQNDSMQVKKDALYL